MTMTFWHFFESLAILPLILAHCDFASDIFLRGSLLNDIIDCV